jgi:type IV secretory pathway VirD2 relaxase
MTDEFDFEPRLGRKRPERAGRARKYLHQVIGAIALAGGVRAAGRLRFSGSRIGKGAAMGRVLGARDRHAGLRGRRVVIKARLVRLGGKGFAGARAHLRYIQRDGVTRDGRPGELYGRDGDRIDGRDFLARGEGDRHQFRLIVSAEDGAEYSDLKPLVRRWMAQMEADLGTRLDWVAVDHLDTGHPHTHVMLRGKDDRGENLVIAPDYIASGMRERLTELVTLDLGPRTDLEIESRQRLDVTAERLTALDRRLLRERDGEGVIAAGHRDPLQHALRAARLRKLAGLGLAEKLGGARWRLAPDIEDRLRRLGERGDIIRTMQRALGKGHGPRPAELVVHDRRSPSAPLIGRIAGRGLSDELRDRHYLIVEGIDGRAHYVDAGPGQALEPLPVGAIVRLTPESPGVRPADRAVAEIAAANDGKYSAALHRAHDPTASASFIEAHVRRLEAIRRGTGGAERLADGSWRIETDHLEKAAAYESKRAAAAPVKLDLLSSLPIERLPEAQGATWLDRELVADRPAPLRDAGFGREARAALAARRQWLLARGLAWEADGATVFAGDLVDRLRRQDVLRAAQGLSEELGLGFREIGSGQVEGRLARRVDLASGRFALLTRSRDFSLVPWRDGMERGLGRELGIELRGGRVSWSLGRGRSGPEIG